MPVSSWSPVMVHRPPTTRGAHNRSALPNSGSAAAHLRLSASTTAQPDASPSYTGMAHLAQRTRQHDTETWLAVPHQDKPTISPGGLNNELARWGEALLEADTSLVGHVEAVGVDKNLSISAIGILLTCLPRATVSVGAETGFCSE